MLFTVSETVMMTFSNFCQVDNIEGYKLTDLGKNKLYLMWSNYWEQITLNGIIPITAMVYFNTR